MLRKDYLGTIAARTRNGYEILTPFNQKSPKGEAAGYLTAMVYLAPHTLGGGKTLCPHSTEACRAGCLFTAGRGRTPRVENARLGRTRLYLSDREEFLWTLIEELVRLQKLARAHDMTMSIRLNGTSDIRWEDERLEGKTLFELFPHARFYDYTNFPTVHRRVPDNWHLTYSMADRDVTWARGMLAEGRSVAAIVPDTVREAAPDWITVAGRSVMIVDGEEDDLRFLDPPGALVLLRPKGRLMRGGSPMVHPTLIRDLIAMEMKDVTNNKSRRGFGSMDPERIRELASKGGSNSSGRPFASNPTLAKMAGQLGGKAKAAAARKKEDK